MVSFVWSDSLPVYSGRGGTESYTIGHIRKLNELGFPARLITIGLGENDGRQYFPDIEFLSIKSPHDLETLDDTIVYVSFPHAVPTRHPAYVILHCPPSDERIHAKNPREFLAPDTTIITNSRFMRKIWAEHLDIEIGSIHIVYPFADPHFATVKRAKRDPQTTRVLYAGRLSQEKGIYSLLEALHHGPLRTGYTFTATTAGNQTKDGQIIESILRHHPWVRVTAARANPVPMARLFGRYDIVVIPSNHQYWHEAFGMVSVEAQHSGCRVVGSDSGGLPETNCGELILYEPGNSYALASAIQMATKAGAITTGQRQEAIKHFTLEESVNSLLAVIGPVARARA